MRSASQDTGGLVLFALAVLIAVAALVGAPGWR